MVGNKFSIMTNQEIIEEVKAIKSDFLERKVTYPDAMDMLKRFSKDISIDFTILYNAFYSSTPEIYFYNKLKYN